MTKYIPLSLDEEIMYCFKKRGIDIEKYEVTEGATKYVIKVKRNKAKTY